MLFYPEGTEYMKTIILSVQIAQYVIMEDERYLGDISSTMLNVMDFRANQVFPLHNSL